MDVRNLSDGDVALARVFFTNAMIRRPHFLSAELRSG